MYTFSDTIKKLTNAGEVTEVGLYTFDGELPFRWVVALKKLLKVSYRGS